jgi:hypothetical protein
MYSEFVAKPTLNCACSKEAKSGVIAILTLVKPKQKWTEAHLVKALQAAIFATKDSDCNRRRLFSLESE